MDVRSTILQRLAAPEVTKRFGDVYFAEETIAAAGCQPHEFWEEIWGLVGEGLVYIDPAGQGRASSWDNWLWKLSATGIQAATGGSWEPRDPEGFLKRLRQRAPTLDDAALVYMREALRSFNARCYLASSVMTGVAAEQVFGRLSSAYVGSQGSPSALATKLENPKASYNQRFEELRKRLAPIRDELPEGLGDNLTLDAVADLLRITRNAAGHPSGELIDEDTAYTHLQMAGRFLAKMTELAEHFEGQGRQGALGDSHE